MKRQEEIHGDIYKEYLAILKKNNIQKVMLICGKSLDAYETGKHFLKDEHIATIFRDFTPNPDFESVIKGVEVFHKYNCQCILAIGGGSAIDVAKGIKAYADFEKIQNDILLIAAPTTAGTGSEATSFAVVYKGEEKHSIEGESLLPDITLFDSIFLKELPLYQKKVTMLDAFCHGIESIWSKASREESRKYAKTAIEIINQNWELYLQKDSNVDEKMLEAANLAGKAINWTKTTAAHAMSYKLTKMFDIPHGHAAALCLKVVWKHTIEQAYANNDFETKEAIQNVARTMGCELPEQALEKYTAFLKALGIAFPYDASEEQRKILTDTVNVERLQNHPVAFSQTTIREMYDEIVENR